MKKSIAVTLLFTILLAGCGEQRSDLVSFENKDKSFAIGFYKDTAFMNLDDDQVKRMGIRGFQKLEGKHDDVLFGFECGSNGGIFTTLFDDKTEDDESVIFEKGTWEMGGKQFIDQVSEEACKIGEQTFAETKSKT